MNLTIIVPVLNNKEIIRNINSQVYDGDEVITLRLTSKNVIAVMNTVIENSINDDILIVNPRDNNSTKSNFLNEFRYYGTQVNNLNKKNKVSHGTSIKFNKILTTLPFTKNVLNILDYISEIYNFSENESSTTFISDTPNFLEERLMLNGVGELKSRPKILFVCDVKGWAWWIKSHYIKKYLENEFDIDIINVIGNDKKGINPNKYDLYFTFGYSYVNSLKRVPFKKTITGVTAHREKRKIASELKKAHALHANSMMLYHQFKDINKNIFYVPNGVDEEMFQPKQKYDILERDYINIGHVGKKSPMKQQETVIEPVVEKLGKNFKYTYHYNTHWDKIPHNEMPKLYKDMDLFIVASLEDGTPNGALEAMASGVPVITNRIGNMPEIIQNGYNGYIVENPTIKNYIKLIQGLDKEHLIEMGKNARQSIENNWTWEHKAENYRAMFYKLLGIK